MTKLDNSETLPDHPQKKRSQGAGGATAPPKTDDETVDGHANEDSLARKVTDQQTGHNSNT